MEQVIETQQLKLLVENAIIELSLMEVRDLKNTSVKEQKFDEALIHREKEVSLLKQYKENILKLSEPTKNIL